MPGQWVKNCLTGHLTKLTLLGFGCVCVCGEGGEGAEFAGADLVVINFAHLCYFGKFTELRGPQNE